MDGKHGAMKTDGRDRCWNEGEKREVEDKGRDERTQNSWSQELRPQGWRGKKDRMTKESLVTTKLCACFKERKCMMR